MRPRKSTNPDVLVREVVRELRDKFEYPDLEGGAAVVLGGGGGGAPTIVVAASNASEFSKQKADFVCPGVNDQDVLQTAHDVMEAVGGRVLCTEGTFHFSFVNSATGLSFSKSGSLQGMGYDATIFAADDDRSFAMFAEIGSDVIVRDIAFESRGNANVGGISLTGEDASIINCEFVTEGPAIRFGTTSHNYVIGCVSEAGMTGPFIETIVGSTSSHILHNRIESTTTDPLLDLQEATETVVAFNELKGAGGILRIEDGTLCVIQGNIIGTGCARAIHLPTVDRCLIIDNTIDRPGEHGIRAFSITNSLIARNYILQPGQDTDNTFDAILLEGDSNENFITGNMLVGSTSAPQPRYAINIGVDCNCNIVVGNRLGPGSEYGTDQLNDLAPDTQLFWPNDATYGDNFIGCFGS